MNIIFWLTLTLLCIIIHGFYSMSEMSCVSYNKIKLYAKVSENNKKALWIHELLKNPSKLFGTTLLTVNIALQVGSECSRELYRAMDLNPNIAPLSQIIIVLLFAELAPMFAARRYSEHVAMLTIPIVYASSKIFTPITWMINILTSFINKIFQPSSSNVQKSIFSREELLETIENIDNLSIETDNKDDFDVIVNNIFNLRNKNTKECMIPLASVSMLEENFTINQLKHNIRSRYTRYIPLYQDVRQNIIGILDPREAIGLKEKDFDPANIKAPWFISDHANLEDVLQELYSHKQNIAVILNHLGQAVGIITIKNILDELLSKLTSHNPLPEKIKIVNKTIPGNMSIENFNKKFETSLPNDLDSISDLIKSKIEHDPEKGQTVKIADLLLTVEEITFFGIQTISVKTYMEH